LKNDRAATISNEIAELVASKTVLISYHSNDPSVGLAASLNIDQFKLFLADTGLMVTLMFKDRSNLVLGKYISIIVKDMEAWIRVRPCYYESRRNRIDPMPERGYYI